MKPIKIGNGILEQIKNPYYYTGIISKKIIYKDWMDMFKDFYKRYPYAVEFDYEKWIKHILNYE